MTALFLVGGLTENVDVSHYKNYNDDNRKDKTDVGFKPCRELYAASGIGFLEGVFPAPANLVSAEERENKSAQGQEVVGEDKVFHIQNPSHEGEAGKHAETKGAVLHIYDFCRHVHGYRDL